MTMKQASNGSWIPLAIIGFFVVIIIVNVVVVLLAVKSHPGVETTEAYEKGRLYNQTIALAEDGKALGWQVSMDIKDAENGDKYFIVSALDKQNNPLKNMEITGIAIRPVSDGSDIRLDFQELGQGRYGAAATLPYPGQWEVDLMISGPDQSKAQHNQRIFIK